MQLLLVVVGLWWGCDLAFVYQFLYLGVVSHPGAPPGICLFLSLFLSLLPTPNNELVLEIVKQQSHNFCTFPNQIAATIEYDINQEYGRD